MESTLAEVIWVINKRLPNTIPKQLKEHINVKAHNNRIGDYLSNGGRR